MKQLPQKNPGELFKSKLPPPVLKKVEVKPEKPIHVDVGFWEALWLLVKSVVRNKARRAMDGEDVGIPHSALGIPQLLGGWWKLGVVVVVILLALFFALQITDNE